MMEGRKAVLFTVYVPHSVGNVPHSVGDSES